MGYQEDWGLVPNMSTLLSPNMQAGNSVAAFNPDWLQSLTGYTTKDGTKTNGWGGPALGFASVLANAYMGMQNYGLAKDQFDFQKAAFNKNWAAQANLTNENLWAKYNSRARAEGKTQAEADAYAKNYLSTYGVKV